MSIAAGNRSDDLVTLGEGRPWLSVRRTRPVDDAPGRPFLLVHGLASNARLWDDVADALAAAGHPVLAVDLRGHGRSQTPPDGYDTDTNADDLAALIRAEGLSAPIVVGQSWGGNVVLTLAARHPGAVAALGCVDGGWIRLRDGFDSFAACWAALAPPRLDGFRYAEMPELIEAAHPTWPPAGVAGTVANLIELPGGGVRARLAREHHESILRSLFDADPDSLYPQVTAPVLLAPALGEQPHPDEDERQRRARAAVLRARAALPNVRVSWYPGADHDLHAEFPDRLARDLRTLARLIPTHGPDGEREGMR